MEAESTRVRAVKIVEPKSDWPFASGTKMMGRAKRVFVFLVRP